MITEQELQKYTQWLMHVWNPNQLHIPFAIDAPRAYLRHEHEVKNLHIPRVSNNEERVAVSTCCGKTKAMNQFLKRPSKYCLTCGKEIQ